MQIFGITKRLLPTKSTDNTQQEFRAGSYGEQVVLPVGQGQYPFALEGSYFKAVNPTFGTGFAPSIATSTAFAEAASSFLVRNSAAAGGPDIYMDYIRFWFITAPTGNTSFGVSIQMDNANRYTSGGGAATVVNVNNAVVTANAAVVLVGALVTTAATSSRKLFGPYILKAAIPAINDEFLLNFGGIDTVATAPGVAKAVSVGPVLLPAGSNHTMLVHLWGAAQSAAGTVHMDMGWIER